VVAGEYARRFALRLGGVIGEGSIRAFGRDADVAPGTLRAILEGRTWPDLETVAKLESSVGEILWPTAAIPEEAGGVRYEARVGPGVWWRANEQAPTEGGV